MSPTFFKSQSAFRKWLARNHDQAAELLVGFYKTGIDKESITYRQALDEALCYGWIDGVRKSLGPEAYTIRFTPRKSDSYWSAVNIARAKELEELGKMATPGLTAFQKRDEARARYSYEQRSRGLDEVQERQFRANKQAWAFFEKQPPYYRRTVAFWVTSAKKEETRQKRLATLIEDSEKGRRIGLLSPRS